MRTWKPGNLEESERPQFVVSLARNLKVPIGVWWACWGVRCSVSLISSSQVSMIRPFHVRRVVGLGVRAGCGGQRGRDAENMEGTEHTEPGSAQRRNEGTKARARFCKLRRNIACAACKARIGRSDLQMPHTRHHWLAARMASHSERRHPERFKPDPLNPVRCFSPFVRKRQGWWICRVTGFCDQQIHVPACCATLAPQGMCPRGELARTISQGFLFGGGLSAILLC